jgi:hypothetical protein
VQPRKEEGCPRRGCHSRNAVSSSPQAGCPRRQQADLGLPSGGAGSRGLGRSAVVVVFFASSTARPGPPGRSGSLRCSGPGGTGTGRRFRPRLAGQPGTPRLGAAGAGTRGRRALERRGDALELPRANSGCPGGPGSGPRVSRAGGARGRGPGGPRGGGWGRCCGRGLGSGRRGAASRHGSPRAGRPLAPPSALPSPPDARRALPSPPPPGPARPGARRHLRAALQDDHPALHPAAGPWRYPGLRQLSAPYFQRIYFQPPSGSNRRRVKTTKTPQRPCPFSPAA